MDEQNLNNENEEDNMILSLNLDFGEEKKDDENQEFSTKMNALLNKLEVQLDNVKKYATMKMPLDSMKTDLFPNNYKPFTIDSFDEKDNYINSNDNIIQINNVIEENNDNDTIKLNEANNNKNNKQDIITNEYQDNNNYDTEKNNNNNDNDTNLMQTNIKIGKIEEVPAMCLKSSQQLYEYNQEELKKEEERKKNEEEEIFRKKEELLKNQEDEQRKKEEKLRLKEEELHRKEEELLQKEKNMKMRENEEKMKIEEEKRRKDEEERRRVEEEEKRRRKEEDEEAQRDRILKEELERLKKEEEEKDEEIRRENDRIRKERMDKEKKEREEEERKKKEEEKKKELERKKKEEELKQEKELKEQINNQNKNNIEEEEVKIVEVDDIEELEEDVSFTENSVFKSKIKQSITKTNVGNGLSTNNEIGKSQLGNKKSINPGVSTNNNINELEESKNNNLKNKSIINNNNINNRRVNPNNKSIKDSKLSKSQLKQSSNPNNVKKPKQQKEPEKDIPESKNINQSVQNFINSKIYSKLSEEVRDKIIGYINAVEDFDIKNPDLDGLPSFPYINKFEKDEKPLSKVIENFNKKIIEKNNEKQLEEKMDNFAAKKVLEGDEEVDKLLTEIAAIPDETHVDIMKKNYEKDNLKNLPKTSPEEANNLEGLEEKLFSEEEFLPEYNCPFSKLEDLQTFIYKYSAHENPKLMGNAYKNFNNWRMTLGDGNSFYRVIMFAIIENCILESNSELLSQILNEISSDQFIDIYKKKNIEYEKPFNILSAILMMTENGLEEKAYVFFLRAYNIKSGHFDLLLIIYLKIIIYNFCEEINKLLDEKMKTSDDKETYTKAKINLDEIDCLYLEPKLNIFYLITFLFDVNINLFLVSGDFINSEDDTKIIVNEEDTTLPTFVFGYFYSSFHILYKPNYDNGIFKNTLENDSPQIEQLTFQLKEKRKCDICFQDTIHLVFLKKKFIACSKCLKAYIKEVLKERKNNILKDKCFGVEYYSRKIHLQNDFYLDDYEYIEIFEDKNIVNELFSSHLPKCIKCGKMENEDLNIQYLNCGCVLCEDCLETIVMELSNNYGHLLECEYEMFKNKKFECNCKKTYTYKDLVELIEISDEHMEEEAEKRKQKYINGNCMNCLKGITKDDKKIKMRKDKGVPDHYMCKQCYNKYFKKIKITYIDDGEEEEIENEDDTKDMAKDKDEDEKDETKNKKIVDRLEQKIYCSICSATHYYKDDDESCGCIIF